MRTIYLLTNNADKLRIARNVLAGNGLKIERADLQLPEIQADTSIEIARSAVDEAFSKIGGPVLREDHSFFIDELGIPGPYMAYVEKMVTVEKIIKIVDTLKNRKAHFVIAAAFIDYDGAKYQSVYKVALEIAKQPAGDIKLAWDRIIKLPNSTQTFAESPAINRDHLWTLNYQRIAEFINSRKI